MDLNVLLGSIFTGGSIGWAVWLKGIKPTLKRRKQKKVEVIKSQELKDKAITDKLDFIAGELKVDGNGSLKTAVINLQKVVQNIMFKLDGIEDTQKLSLNMQGVCYWISNEQGECTYVSPNFCELVGRSEAELLNKNWFSWIYNKDKKRIVEAWEFMVEHKTSFDEMYTIQRADRMYLRIWSVAFPKIGKGVYGGIMAKANPIEGPFWDPELKDYNKDE